MLENRELQEKVWQELRAKLKAAVAKKDHQLVLQLHDEAMARFEEPEIGYPDYWQDWERAQQDAIVKINHASSGWQFRPHPRGR